MNAYRESDETIESLALRPLDLLLEWASELGAGTWSEWRRACRRLSLEPSLAAHNMSILGHVEFDWHLDEFAVVPSSAVFVSGTSGCLLMAGSRPRGYLQAIREYEESTVDCLSFCVHGPVSQLNGPRALWLEVETNEMEQLCAGLSLELCLYPGKAMLGELPPATLENVGEESYPDERYAKYWLEPRGLRESRPPADGGGLWSVHEYRRKFAYIRQDGTWFRILEREYGPYLAYPRETYIRHRVDSKELLVHNRAPLPILAARTASLHTGFLPEPGTNGSNWHIYQNIDEELAFLISNHLSATVAAI
jgi:hypothetical protein